MKKLIDIPDEILEAFEMLCVKEKTKPKPMIERIVTNYTKNYWAEKGYMITPNSFEKTAVRGTKKNKNK